MLGDLDSTFSFPPHIAFTELRPDIIIFSNELEGVILIELTCPREENMEAWHNTKVNKCLPRKSVFENNSWNVDLFAVEVGAKGYCSRSVFVLFQKPRLKEPHHHYHNKTTKLVFLGMLLLYLAGQKQCSMVL